MTDAVVGEDLPATGLSGWCQDAQDAVRWELDPREVKRLHLACPAIFWPTVRADPARKGTTFTTTGWRCSCVCHSRPVLSEDGHTTKGTKHDG